MQAPSPDHAEEDLADLIDDAVPTRGFAMTPVVGVGGSAGAIPALAQLLAHVPADSGLAYVVVLHLAADRDSALAELLARNTVLPVVQVTGRTRIEPDHVYVIPPDRFLVSAESELEVVARPQERGGRTAVDLFFRTLADTHGPHAAAVVLSGGDSDGVIGIKRIKERGGLTIAQDPREAEHSGMPDAAIATELVDWVLPAAQIGARVVAYFQMERRLVLPDENGALLGPVVAGDPDELLLHQVLDFLHGRTGTDFR